MQTVLMADYIPPSFEADRFTCPHCSTVAQQSWGVPSVSGLAPLAEYGIGRCLSCKDISLWSVKGSSVGVDSPAMVEEWTMFDEVAVLAQAFRN